RWARGVITRRQLYGVFAECVASSQHEAERVRQTGGSRRSMTTIQRAYKTELDLNDQQVTACRKHAGAARWAYNWGLARKQDAYKATGRSPSAVDLHRELNALKRTEVPWMYEVSKCAPQEALRNLDAAFAHCFRRCQLKQEGKSKGTLGYPQRKTRKQ